MERAAFVIYLQVLGVPYKEVVDPDKGIDQIWVYERSTYERAQNEPELFVPYIRVSHFDEEMWYVKDCGLCNYWPIDVILDKVNELYES